MKNRFLRILVFGLGVFLIVSLSRSIIDIWQKGGLLDKEEERLAKARLENEELAKELERLQSPEYIEKQAREKLGLGREGEVVVVLPPQVGSPSPEVKIAPKQPEKAVWQQWVSFLLD